MVKMNIVSIIHIFLLGLLLTLGSCVPESGNADPAEIEAATETPPPPQPDFTVVINQVSGQADPTSVFPIEYRVVFGAKINPTSFTAADITQNGTATGVEWEIENLGNDQSFNVHATVVATEGTVIPSLNAGVVNGLNSNANLASASTDNSVFYEARLAVVINQKSSQADPANSLNIEYDVIFTSPIQSATFTTADITQNGTATGITWNIIDHGDGTTFTLQATAITGGPGTVIPSIAAGLVSSQAPVELNLASTSGDNSVTWDPKFDVTIDQKLAQLDPTATLPIEFDIIFSEAINNVTFDTSDITQNGTATGITWALINQGNDINFTLRATTITGEGTVIPSIAAGAVQTAVLGQNNASTNLTDGSVTYRTKIDVTVNQKGTQLDPAELLPVEFDVVFSEAITPGTFTTADIVQNGTATVDTWTITDSGDATTFYLRATAISTTGTVTPSLNASVVTTADGADNNASTATDNEVTYEPKVDVNIEQKTGQADPTGTLPVEFTFTFSEAINPATFTTADIIQNGTATVDTWTITDTGDQTVFTVRATAISVEGVVKPIMNANVVTTTAGKPNRANTGTDNEVTYRTKIDVTVNQKSGQADPTNATPVEFDVVFSEAINPATFTTGDITQNGTATGITWTITDSGDATTFYLRATAVTGTGTIIPSLADSVAQTADGANNNASTATDNSVTFNVNYQVTINQKGGQADPATSLPIEFDVVFSQTINAGSFTPADITQNGTASGITWTITDTGDQTTFTLRATAITTAGTVIPSLDEALTDDGGSAVNDASTSTDNSVTYNVDFDVTVNQKGGQADPTTSLPVEFDVVFSEAITPASFTTADITQNGTATGITWTITDSGDATTFYLRATAVSGEGTLIPSIAANTVTTGGGGDNNASTSTDNSVHYRTKIDVTIDQKSGQADPTNATPVEFDVVFSEAINPATFSTADITQNGTATVTTWTITDSGDATTFYLRATAVSADGTIIPSIADSLVQTTDGANNNASTSTDNSVTFASYFDVTIEQKGAQADPTASTPVEFDVVFAEAINPATFTSADVTQNGTATGITWTVTDSGDATTFYLRATAVTGAGTIIPSLASDVVQNGAGANNNASTSTDNSVTYVDSFTVTINQKGAQADPTSSLPVEFDVVFERAITNATFTTADITQNGTATGVTWTITNSGDDINYTLRATAFTGTGTIIPSISAGLVTEVLGTTNSASTATDNSVTVYGTPVKLAFTQEPTNTPTSTNISPAITVEIQDATGNVVPTSTDNITLAIGTDPTSGSATLGGTLTVAAVNGVATFSNIQIDVGDTGFDLNATATGLTSATSASFDITLTPTKLKFSVYPTDSAPSTTISPAIKVEIRDVNDAVVTSATDNITLSFQNDPSTGSATLGGTLTIAAVNGVATFSDIDVDTENPGYTLKATASGLTQDISTPFDILPTAPTNITLIDPGSSPDSDSTPTVRVHGVLSGDIVKVFTDSNCTTQVASYAASGTTVDATTSVLAEGVHTLYANRSVGGNTSTCSTANLSYEVSGSFDQMDNMDTLGNWSNVGGDDRDWSIGSGETPSTDVGPLTGNGGSGSYAFTEASYPVSANDEFHLESNTLDGATYPLSFDFYWNKRGDDMGDLIVEASNNGGSSWTQVWSHTGADMPTGPTDAWRHQFIDLCTLGYTANNVMVRFRGVMPSTGTVWNSDMAVDDLHFASGGCAPAPPATVAITSPDASTLIDVQNVSTFTVSGTCSDNGQNVILSGDVSGVTSCSSGTWSFNLDLSAHADGDIVMNVDHISGGGGANGTDSRTYTKDTTVYQFDDFETDFGNWTNVAYDQQDFTRLQGDTASNNVGPTSDKSGTGYYIYTEASNPRSANDEFIIESNSLPAGTYNLALEFYWNKRGDNMGDINVEVSTNGGSTWDAAVWTHTGTDVPRSGSDVWNQQSVDLCNAGYTSGNIMVRFRITMPASGNVWHSDIGLDEIKVKTTGCP
jgi:hypothetical protein